MRRIEQAGLSESIVRCGIFVAKCSILCYKMKNKRFAGFGREVRLFKSDHEIAQNEEMA